jgi:hypothetical protein
VTIRIELFQISQKLRGSLIPIRGIWLQASRDDLVDSERNVQIDLADRTRRLVHSFQQLGYSRLRAGSESHPAQQHVVQHQPERVNIRALIDLLASRLLGRHVSDGSDDGASHRAVQGRDRPCDTEVRDEREIAVDHDVFGF